MDRTQVEALLNGLYAARIRGDASVMAELFTDDAQFRLAGSPRSCPVAGETKGKANLRRQFEELIRGFEFKEHAILKLMIDGSSIAMHSRIAVRATASGKAATTEVFDLIELRDGRIASFTQFADTAFVMWLAG